jgi:nucleotide-binding universal stress UspA family protein
MSLTELPSKRIMVAVDGSKFGTTLVDWVLANLVHANDLIMLVHVRKMAIYDQQAVTLMLDVDPSLQANIEDAYEAESRELLSRLAKTCRAKGVSTLEQSIFGDPRDALLTHIEEHKPDVIVVGRHGKGHRLHMLIGSVSKCLVRHAQIPVIVVNGQQ